jgi:VWFA-related protein
MCQPDGSLILRIITAAVLAATFTMSISSHPAAGPQQAAQPPVFRTGVDLLTVPVSVIDATGRPVRDLGPADFTVTVDGRPRKVLFARFSGSVETDVMTASAETPALPAGPVDNTATAGGRLILFVVDRDSLKPGSEKALLEASAVVLDALTPADAAGVLTIPTGGVNPTRDHARVREELKRVTGTQPSSATANRDRFLTWEEALAYERGDRITIGRVVERECYNIPQGTSMPPNICPEDLRNQARDMLFAGRAHVQTVMASLGAALKTLAAVRGPKYVVLLSGGQAFDQELLVFYNQFAREAAAAQIMLHAVHVDQPDSDASNRRVLGSAFGGRDLATGLTTMTGMTGGGYYAGVGRAAGVFDRIRTEIGNDYLLGVETLPSDADGTLRDLKVTVRRPDATVRARKQVLLTPRAEEPPPRRLLTLLNQPTDVADLPLAVSSYTTRGEEPATLRTLLSVEVGRGQALGASEWAFAVFDGDKVVAEGRQELADEGGRRAITTSVQLAPGRYRARIAAADPDGRVGVIDTPLTVGLRAAGKLQISDVILGTTIADRMQPQSRIRRGLPLVALLEAVSADVDLLERTRVALEVYRLGSAEADVRLLMASRSGTSAAVLLSEARIDTTALPPGRYMVSAIPLVDGQPTGRVSRVFEVLDDK